MPPARTFAMSLRSSVQFEHAIRHGQIFRPVLQYVKFVSGLHDNIRAYHRAAKHTNRAPSTPRLLSDLRRPAHTIQTHGKIPLINQCRHESSISEPEICAHCQGTTNPKSRRRVDPHDRAKGWHCKACIKTVNTHGKLPNEEQLASIRRRRLWRESNEQRRSSPCRGCGIETMPNTRRQLVDHNDPSAGFHCRACARRELSLQTEPHNCDNELWNRGFAPGDGIPIARNREHPCDHCGEPVTPEKKRRYVDSTDSPVRYYCRSCARRLALEDKLPTEEQLKAIKVLRGKLAKFVTARKQKSPCRHCGDITLPGSRRKLVDPGDFSSGYYCRPCGRHLVKRDELPTQAMLDARRLRRYRKLKRLGPLDSQQELGSNTDQTEQAKSTVAPGEKAQG